MPVMNLSNTLKAFVKKVNDWADAQETRLGTPFLVFDVETPNSNNDRISSIALTKMDGSRILWTRSYLINPEVPFTYYNVKLTGIRPDDVNKAPTFPTIWAKISPEFEHTTLVAHNAGFDLSVIEKTCKAYQINFSHATYIDTLEVARELLPELEHHRLNDVAEHLHIPLQHHQAKNDCLACAKILRWALKKDSFDLPHFLNSYTPSCGQRNTVARRPSKRKPSQKTTALNELQTIMRNAIADDQITEAETHEIYDWLTAHEELKGNFPFDVIYSTITDALADGILEPQELEQLLSVCQMLVDPLHYLPRCNCDSVDGKLVCLTGDFAAGDPEEIEAKLALQGAIIKDNVVLKLDYLFVGSLGSAAWASGNYGAIVKKALEYQSRGKPIKIMLESEISSLLR